MTAGCGASGDTTIEGTAAGGPTSAPSSAPATTSAASASTPATTPASPEATAPTASTTAAGGTTTTPATTAPAGAECSAKGFAGPANTTGAPAPAAATANAIFTAAVACDQATLIGLASSTTLGRVDADASAVFALPDTDGRYRVLAQTLASAPGISDDEVIWPKAAADPTGSYSGYLVSISSSGTWTAFYK